MNTALVASVYAAVLHLAALVSVVVLMGTGHLDTTTGMGILGGLLGFAVGVPVAVPNLTKTDPPKPPAA